MTHSDNKPGNKAPRICLECRFIRSGKKPWSRIIVHECMKYNKQCGEATASCSYAMTLLDINKRVSECEYHNARFVSKFKDVKSIINPIEADAGGYRFDW